MQLRYFAALHDIAGERSSTWSSRCPWTCSTISAREAMQGDFGHWPEGIRTVRLIRTAQSPLDPMPGSIPVVQVFERMNILWPKTTLRMVTADLRAILCICRYDKSAADYLSGPRLVIPFHALARAFEVCRWNYSFRPDTENCSPH